MVLNVPGFSLPCVHVGDACSASQTFFANKNAPAPVVDLAAPRTLQLPLQQTRDLDLGHADLPFSSYSKLPTIKQRQCRQTMKNLQDLMQTGRFATAFQWHFCAMLPIVLLFCFLFPFMFRRLRMALALVPAPSHVKLFLLYLS